MSERSIVDGLHKLRKQLTSYIRQDSQNVRLDELSNTEKDKFAELKLETGACSKSRAEARKN